MRILFVINPVSGDIDKAPFIDAATAKCDRYGIAYQLFKTTGEADAPRLATILTSFRPDRVAAVGGDGTQLFTALALRGHRIPMGIIPLGSANGLATDLAVSADPMSALEDLIMSEMVVSLDMLVINDEHYLIHMGDVGVNANIVKAFANDENRGMAVYAKCFIEKLLQSDPFPVQIQCDGKTYTEEGLMVGICNCRKFGTGIPLNLVGSPTDGKFEIVVIKEVNVGSLVKAGLSTFNHRFYDHQNSKVFSTNRVTITFDQPRLLQSDGEILGEYEKLKVAMISGAVPLITHRDNPYLG